MNQSLLSHWILAASLAISPLQANEPRIASTPIDYRPEPVSLGEQLKNLGLLYQDKTNPYLQEFWLLGRYHGHYHDASGSEGDSNAFESRRTRFGFQTTMFERLTLHAQAISGSDFDPDYNGFTELWVRWKFADELQLTIGQQKHRFTHDRNVSSRYMNYLERAQFTNMMALDYTPAVTFIGEVGKLDYNVGVFSNAAGRDMWSYMTELNSGWSFLAAFTYDMGQFLGCDTAEFYGGYLHSDANDNATNLTRFDDSIAGALILTEGPASLMTEITAGFGGERGSAIGLNFQPGFYLTDDWQVVARYQLAFASEADGLVPQRRYERPAGMDPGDLYQAIYLGVNHYIADHRIKVISGIEYANMNGQDNITASIGFRMFFGPQSNAPFPGNKMLEGYW
jgi:phosphate-selective porin OprO/OprP